MLGRLFRGRVGERRHGLRSVAAGKACRGGNEKILSDNNDTGLRIHFVSESRASGGASSVRFHCGGGTGCHGLRHSRRDGTRGESGNAPGKNGCNRWVWEVLTSQPGGGQLRDHRHRFELPVVNQEKCFRIPNGRHLVLERTVQHQLSRVAASHQPARRCGADT